MPIIQISEIRHRRGLKQDLPNLAEGELGLTVDTGELFIGTPNLPAVDRDVVAFVWKPNRAYEVGEYVAFAGVLYRCNTTHTSTVNFAGAFWDAVDDSNYNNPNTKILTEWSKNVEAILKYSFIQRNQLINPNTGDGSSVIRELDEYYSDLPDVWPYQAVKRIGNSSYEEFAVRRFLQERLDERVSVLSYGATGNGRIDLVENTLVSKSRMDAEANAIRRAVIDLSNTLQPDVTDGELNERGRAVHLPAGTYVVNKSIFLTNNTTLIGDGVGKTRVIFNIEGMTLNEINNVLLLTVGTNNMSGFHTHMSVDGAVVETEVSKHTYQNISQPVTNIFVRGISFEIVGTPASGSTVRSADAVRLIRSSGVVFSECEFVGNWNKDDYHTARYTPATDSMAVGVDSVGDSQSSPFMCSNIIFDRCSFKKFYYLTNATDSMDGINFVDCSFDRLYRGIVLGEPTQTSSSWMTTPPSSAERNGPRNVKVYTSRFTNIASSAVVVSRGYLGDGVNRPETYAEYVSSDKLTGERRFEQASGVILSGNHYDNVGNYNDDVLVTIEEGAIERPLVPVVIFGQGSKYNMSVGETFTRDITVTPGNRNQSRVWHDTADQNVIMNAQDALVFRTEEAETHTSVINPSTTFVEMFPSMALADLSDMGSENTFDVVYTIVYANYSQSQNMLYRRRAGRMLVTVDSNTNSASMSEDYSFIGGHDDIKLRAYVNADNKLVIQSHFTNNLPISTHAVIYYKVEKHISPNA